MDYLKPSSPVQPNSGAFAIRFFATVLAVGTVVAFSAWALYGSLQSAERQAEQRASNIALVAQDDVASAIYSLDKDMQTAVHGLDVPGLASMDAPTQQKILFGHPGEEHLWGGMVITDEAGRRKYWSSSLTNPPLDYADRPQFRAQKANDGAGLIFSDPMRSLMDGSWIMGASRRINHPDGSFAGVVLGRAPLSYFQQLFARFDIGPQGVISLIGANGILAARQPKREEEIGKDLSSTDLLRAVAQAPSGFTEQVAASDGVRRIYSYGKIPGLPFIVAVGLPTWEIYVEWLRNSALLCLLVAVLGIVGAALTWWLWREYRRRGLAEIEAKKSEQSLQLLLEHAEGHGVYLLDPAGQVVSWNSGAEKLKGYTRSEIIGRGFEVFFTSDDVARGEPARLLAFAAEHGHYHGEAQRVRKNGCCFPSRVSITAIHDSGGKLRGFAKVTHDLSLRQIEDEQRAIMIESTVTGMLVVNEDGKITQTNSSADQIFGYAQGTLAGHCVDVLAPEDLRSSQDSLHNGFGEEAGTGLFGERQVRGRRQDGSEVKVEATLRRVRTNRGSIVVISVIDATDRLRRAQERADKESRERSIVEAANARLEQLSRHLAQSRDQERQANEAKSRFLTGVTHELRTPLNGILGYAQLLAMEGGLNEVQNARVQAMQEAGEHLLGMINAVLDLSEIEADRIELHFGEVDLVQLGRACLDLVRPAAQTKDLALNLLVHPAVQPIMTTDRIRLRQVLVNLLGNAVKFTGAGYVELRLLPASMGSHIHLEVADTGPGITPEYRQRLFKEFDRLDAPAMGLEAGSGLGLAISSRLIHRLGGTIEHADNPGGGSLFWTELPRGDTSLVEPKELPAAQDPGAKKSLRILVVDDVSMNRDVADAFLRFAGHDVVCAEDGLAAVEAVAEGEFDAVLMDVRMPGIDGLEATRRIRALPGRKATVPIVAMTAQAFSEQIRQCMEAGMTGHVAKPFQQNSLLAAVIAAIAKKDAPSTIAGGFAAAPQVGLPVLNEAIYRMTAGYFKPADRQRHLTSLLDRGEKLAAGLRTANLIADLPELLEAAHVFGGAAGSLGFVRVADAAKSFEHSVESDEPDSAERAELLREATEASLAAMQHLIEEALARA